MRIMVENISDQQKKKEIQTEYKTKISLYRIHLTRSSFVAIYAVSITTLSFSLL
jgi:hypothetical protein